LFVFLRLFFFWSLYSLSFESIRLLITPFGIFRLSLKRTPSHTHTHTRARAHTHT
jgi:hypothetical protein